MPKTVETAEVFSYQSPTPNGLVRGYLPGARQRYRWVTCDWTDFDGSDDPDGEPFRAELRSNLTWGEIDDIDLSGTLSYAELWPRIARHVRAWNALGIDVDTGATVPVPPPAEAGPDAFRALEPGLTMWMATQLRIMHLGGDERGKESSAPDSSPEPENGAPSD